ncbi:hypothetical protein [Vibrio parahaemolyticus]|uniref:hypothetical protein n=1 Tax=Vibrio parahaemolyticus TaxID=670 RepID=UPI00193D4B63|nr:hypothetical protein [Vibrio parahaemolyticus]MBM5064308.1 hypothetical protein [Vibrio parahaemolyticus]MDN4734746.1 hypothetical protein [Vibrio parahaemolyticus]MDN4734771.1 hypothetical protein [Vibrio parahaemolyticus]MDS1997853.1 hypothetical protein [Vibrio parahaemolyticus]
MQEKNAAVSQDLVGKAQSPNQAPLDLFFGAVSFGLTELNFFVETLLVEFVSTKADLLAEVTFSLVW